MMRQLMIVRFLCRGSSSSVMRRHLILIVYWMYALWVACVGHTIIRSDFHLMMESQLYLRVWCISISHMKIIFLSVCVFHSVTAHGTFCDDDEEEADVACFTFLMSDLYYSVWWFSVMCVTRSPLSMFTLTCDSWWESRCKDNNFYEARTENWVRGVPTLMWWWPCCKERRRRRLGVCGVHLFFWHSPVCVCV